MAKPIQYCKVKNNNNNNNNKRKEKIKNWNILYIYSVKNIFKSI